MIADVGAAWRPVYAVDSVEFKNLDGGTMKTPIGGDPERSIEQSIEKRMKEMMLPSIAFRPPATIIDAVDFFRQASKDFDRPDIPIDQRGFNFILTLDKTLTGGEAPAADNNAESAFGGGADDSAASGAVPQIPNISASNLSLWEAMGHVCKSCGFKFKVQGSVVMVMPKNMTTDELITRSYNVVESFVDRMNDASSGLKNEQAGALGGGGNNDSDNEDPEAAWKKYFEEMGVAWPLNSRIKYIKAIGKLRVTNTADQLAILEQALNELNVTPMLIEIETRFVEVAQEDLNSLGFEWLLNSDYSFNVGVKLKKALNLKDGAWNIGETGYKQTDGTKTITTTEGSTYLSESGSEQLWKRTTDPLTGVTTWTEAGTQSTGPTVTKTTTGPDVSSTLTETYTWSEGASTGWSRRDNSGDRYRTGKNVGINAVNGTDYSSGMRYLSTQDNHISGKGESTNDQFMRVNAFLGNADLSMILHMLSQRSDTDLLSAPKVVTKSGQEATIKVVTIYRYPQDYDVTIQSTSSSSSTSISGTSGGSDGKILPMVEPQNFETQEVGVILTCTPDVSAEGQMINLQLTPKVIGEPTWRDYGMKVPMSSVMSSTAQAMALASGNEDMQWFTVPMEQPFFKERSIDTKVTLYNGATIVMGGLITEERKSMEDKIPFLGDIPFVGRIFRSRSEWSNKRNLLIFVTARLVDPRGRQISLTEDSTASAEQAEAGVTPAPNK
jgi:type II secretory pathway component GspD/PulD (secretin)